MVPITQRGPSPPQAPWRQGMPAIRLAAMLCYSFMGVLGIVGVADVARGESPSERLLNFELDVLPIFERHGCNTSTCHGKAEGQNGFKLSVFGSEPESDYRALLMQGRGRRVFPAAPQHSLLLLKASGGLPHGGRRSDSTDQSRVSNLGALDCHGRPLGRARRPSRGSRGSRATAPDHAAASGSRPAVDGLLE